MDQSSDNPSQYANFSETTNQQKKPIQWQVDALPSTRVGKMKQEALYIFWFEFLGTFMLTFCIYATNNNAFVFCCAYLIMILLAQNQKCTFNPAVTTILGANDKSLWISVAIGSQFAGAFIAGLVGLLSFSNYVNDVPYLDQATLRYFPAVFIGEVIGSLILTSGFLFQYDEVLDFGKDKLENGIVISSLYGVGRATSYIAQSSLNPAIALSLIFFECCKDGEWSRFWNSWIFIGLPFAGAFLALSFVNLLYKKCFEQQVKIGLRI